MTQEEWTQGIHNEAHTVQDEQWTAEAMAHLRNRQRQTAVRRGVGAVLAGLVFGAGLGRALVTQTVILEHQRTPADLNLFTFMPWSTLSAPQPTQTVLTGYSPALPIVALALLTVSSVVATRRGMPHWVTLVAAATSMLTTAFMTLLILPSFPGLPLIPMLAALGAAALGVTLGRPAPQGRRGAA